MRKCDKPQWIKDLNPLLIRQVEKYLCDINQSQIGPFQEFIQSISEVYDSNDKEKKMTDRMFDISAQEYQEINNRLLNEKLVIEKSIEVLLKAIEQFQEGPITQDKSNLIEIAEFLKDQAIHQKQIESELLQAKEEAIRANNAKSDFLSTMSHEIRTPLNVIVGIIHVLLEEQHLPSQQENLEIVSINADNLKYLINDILDFSKIESGKLELEQGEIHITELLQNIKKAHIPPAAEKGLALKLFLDDEIPEAVVGDSMRLGQIISNLVANAIKYTEEGEIDITCTVLNQNKQQATIQFSVHDTGIGIPKNEQDLVFEPFRQASNRLRQGQTNHGTGLGLSIISQLVQFMNSKIDLQSTEGVGSTFSFVVNFPLAEINNSKQLTNQENPTESPLNQHKRILVVEDFHFNVLVIQKVLNKFQVQLEIAENGQQALDILERRAHDFDLILMDLRMPIMDGITATKEIRQRNITTPIIALTASTTVETMKTVKEIGMNGFISKPIEPKGFIEKIEQFI